jgi:hypothetical protein
VAGVGAVAVVLAVFGDLAGRPDAALIFGTDVLDELREPSHIRCLMWLSFIRRCGDYTALCWIILELGAICNAADGVSFKKSICENA